MSNPASFSSSSLHIGRYTRIFDAEPSQSYAEGTVLFKQGANALNVYLLEQGLVKITFLNPDGEPVIVQLCTDAGTVFGDVCAVLGKHFVSASVVTHNALLRRVPAAYFNDLIRNDAKMSWSLHNDHCLLLSQQIERTAHLGYLSARQRVENLLWKLAGACELTPTSKGLRMQLPLKYRDLAQLVAVSPEHLCRMLGAIEKDGLIQRDKGWLYLSDRDRLWHLSSERAG